MKTSLTLLGLFLALALPGEALAELAGLRVPAVLNVENTLALFTATFALLLLIAEYRPRLSALPVRSGRNRETGPAVLGVTVMRSNVYGIRRLRSVRPKVAA
jgi:hypothetical protein